MKGIIKGVSIAVSVLYIIDIFPVAQQSDQTTSGVRQVSFQQQYSPAIAQNQKYQDEDKQVQQMAVQTVAAMANNLINIGSDPYNPQVVGPSVVNIVGSFVNFVVTAMRHPELIDLVQNEEFQRMVRSYVFQALEAQASDECEHELNQERENI